MCFYENNFNRSIEKTVVSFLFAHVSSAVYYIFSSCVAVFLSVGLSRIAIAQL